MIRLYKAFILPRLEYCGPLFVGIGKIQSNRIDSANYYISKTLLGHAKSVPYEQLLKTVGMLHTYTYIHNLFGKEGFKKRSRGLMWTYYLK